MTLTKEKWLWIKGYEGAYDVSNLGNVRGKNEGLLKPYLHNGFLQISLYLYGEKQDVFIHRLVAQAFLDNPDGRVKIRFKNGNKLDCRVDNLEFGNADVATGKSNPRAKRIGQYDLNGQFVREWDCGMDVKRELGYNPGAISSVAGGRKPTAYGYIWKYLPN